MNTTATLRAAVEALISGERDTASQKIKDYFVAKSSAIISPVTEGEAFDVFKGGKRIDTVFFDGHDCESVKKSLIDHDGFDADITVKKSTKNKKDNKDKTEK